MESDIDGRGEGSDCYGLSLEIYNSNRLSAANFLFGGGVSMAITFSRG